MGSLRKRPQPPKTLEIATPKQWQDSLGLSVFMADVERNMFIESIFKTFSMYVDSMEITILLYLCVYIFFLDSLNVLI